MNRRALLRGCAAVASGAALSGCTTESLQEAERTPPLFDGVRPEDVELPVRQRLEVAAAAIERAERAEVRSLDGLESVLEEHGVRVSSLEETTEKGRPLVSLEYVVEEQFERGLMADLGTVAGGYAALVEAGHERDRLDAHVLDVEETEFGSYEVRRSWASEYGSGAFSARTYAEKIAVTVGAE